MQANNWKQRTKQLGKKNLEAYIPTPVSYTHLDVYKRQGKDMLNVRSIGEEDLKLYKKYGNDILTSSYFKLADYLYHTNQNMELYNHCLLYTSTSS